MFLNKCLAIYSETFIHVQAGMWTRVLLSKQADSLSVFAAQNQPVFLFVAVLMRTV